MSKVVVLGGAGGVGCVAVRGVASGPWFDEVVVADVREEAALSVAGSLGRGGARGVGVNAESREELLEVMRGADVVLNCAGPFYRFGPPILEAAIEAGVNYVDVCDDLAPTVKMLELDERAKQRGVRALIGMGNSPGLANVFVALCAQTLLEQVESVDIMHIHGGEPEEGPAVMKHRIHAMVKDVPMYVDGAFVSVRQLEPSGQAFVREVEFRQVGTYPVYPYPHPETITLPRYIPGLRRATNLGVIFPLSYFRLTQEMVRVGACTETPLRVGGTDVSPLEFSVAHILSRRAELLREAGVTGPGGCLRVDVSGTRGGKRSTMIFQLSSMSAGAGEGTGIPAAVGAVLMKEGKVERTGVFPPEAGVPPFEVLTLALGMVQKLGSAGRDSILVEHVDENGVRTPVPLPV